MKNARPLSKQEVTKLESMAASEPVPSKFASISNPVVRFSLPDGEAPRVETESVGTSEGRTLWRISTILGSHSAQFWPGLKVHSRQKTVQKPARPVDGYRPPWMDLHYRPQLQPMVSPRLMHRGREVKPLEGLHILRDNGYPWACVGLTTNSDGFTGSGSLVGSRLVLTASHCVPWQSINSGKGWSMTFSPNLRSLDFSNPMPFGLSYVSDVLWYRQVAQVAPHDTFDTGEDYAVLRLYDPLGERVGWFGNTEYSEDWDDLNVWENVGYPGGVGPFAQTFQSIVDGDSPGVFGQGSGLDLETYAQLLPGMSGGPFWAWFDIGGGNYDPRITGVVSATSGSNWLGGGSEMVALVDDARQRWP